uniref:Argininosuccinate lyase n=1 Tax=Cannabis sativa TaxID=3483 RepID=A0A803PQ14_CANSA
MVKDRAVSQDLYKFVDFGFISPNKHSSTMISLSSLHSVQLRFMCCFIISIAICLGAETSKILCTEKERQSLLKFKQGLLDESNVLSSWESQKDCCKWKGIKCNNQTGHVIMVDLSHNISDVFSVEQPLAGEISSSLLELTELNYLDLSFNTFDGLKIPSFMGSFQQLKHLKLASVGFVGPIPHQLRNLTGLHTLDLSMNYLLTVNDLDWLTHFSSLRYLNLTRLNLSEIVNWPLSMAKLPSLIELQLSSTTLPDPILSSLPLNNFLNSLEILNLSDNHFSPSIFYWISNISSKLIHLGLMACQIQGPIPDVFTNMASLMSLDLSHNQLKGGLPKSFKNMCSLESLNLESNKFSDRLYDSIKNLSCAEETMKYLHLSNNPFWGPFPDLTNFSSLIELFIDGTNMSGPLPKNLSQFSNLNILSLAYNQLNGSLPDFTGLSSLRLLFLANNQLSGYVPESIGKLYSLEVLFLSSNSLNGVLTEAHFLNLSHLNNLDISHNPLSLTFSSDWIPPFQLEFLNMETCNVGPEFPKWLQTQKKLRSLYMPNATISDSIPIWFWNLSTTLTELNFSYNQIHGQLPNLSPKQKNYFSLDLSYNNLSGPIPLLSSATNLILSNNIFSGPLSSLCEAPALQLFRLDLSNNRLSGELPSCWIHYETLLFLNLAKNNFSGNIPISLSHLKNLVLLRLHDNNLSGEVPSLEDCKELRVIDLGRNKLTGMLPTFQGQSLPNLLVLRLRHNEIHGSLPLSLCSLPALHVLDLSENNISGSLPECLNNITAMSSDVNDNIIIGLVQVVWKGIEIEFGQNLKHLRSIDISSNNLGGKIPETFTSLLKIISLNLSRNHLTGTIPEKFDKLSSNLESVDLSRNWLTGSIPTSFSSLNFLSYLDLSYNNLSGRIPKGTQLQSFDASSYVGNLQLCGQPLTQDCPGDEMNQDPGAHDGDGDDKDEGAYIGWGFQVFGFGFWNLGIEPACMETKFFEFRIRKYFPKHKLLENLIATTDAKVALLGADYCLHVVPVQGQIPESVYAMVVASKDKKLANAVQQLLASDHLRINTSRQFNMAFSLSNSFRRDVIVSASQTLATPEPKENKLWGGRFEESVTDAVERFTESISFDKLLYKHDIMGSRAHASMLAKQGLISNSDRDIIIEGLNKIEKLIEDGKFEWRTDREDVHMNIEAALIDMIGEPGKKLHTARSRNDQVLTDFRLWCRDAIDLIVQRVKYLQVALLKLAIKNEGLIVPGYTHLQRAQPVLLQHLLLAFVEQLERDAGRLLDCRARLNFCPLGACALAGTGLPIDRFMTADELGFTGPLSNSIDAVSDRDFILEFLSANSIIAIHLSRLGEEWVLWASEEFGFITPSDAVSTGSSIMPQKKNPDPMELEDKEPSFDSVKTILGMLEVSAEFAQNITFNEERIKKALPAGHLDATTLADYLVKKGVPFRTSHDIVGRAVALCVSKNCQLKELSLDELRSLNPVFDKDVYEYLGVENAVEKFSSYGSTGSSSVAYQVDYWVTKLGITKET